MNHRQRFALAAGALVAAASAAVFVSAKGSDAPAPLVPPAHFPGMLTGPAPWSRNVSHLRARLAAIGLPALPSEGTVLHIHQHLDVVIDGARVEVPAGIGIDAAETFISPLHTHDSTGIIHVESPTVETFTLGQFFAVWGVRFTPTCLGGYCASGAKRLRVYVDGRSVKGDPRRIPLEEHEEILVAFGTRAQVPRPVPRSFAFPSGL
jgi:hypothetical protein